VVVVKLGVKGVEMALEVCDLLADVVAMLAQQGDPAGDSC